MLGRWRTEQPVVLASGHDRGQLDVLSQHHVNGTKTYRRNHVRESGHWCVSGMVKPENSGVDGNRTHDPLLAKQVL